MFKQVDYITVNTSDMKRSVEFYRDRLGLPVKSESDFWTEFDTGSSTLALHAVPLDAKATPGNNSTRPEPLPGTCHLGLRVPDIRKVYESLKAQGVPFVVPPTDRPREGIKLAVCSDPDGLAVTFSEPLTSTS